MAIQDRSGKAACGVWLNAVCALHYWCAAQQAQSSSAKAAAQSPLFLPSASPSEKAAPSSLHGATAAMQSDECVGLGLPNAARTVHWATSAQDPAACCSFACRRVLTQEQLLQQLCRVGIQAAKAGALLHHSRWGGVASLALQRLCLHFLSAAAVVLRSMFWCDRLRGDTLRTRHRSAEQYAVSFFEKGYVKASLRVKSCPALTRVRSQHPASPAHPRTGCRPNPKPHAAQQGQWVEAEQLDVAL